jgi:hypothetical protein
MTRKDWEKIEKVLKGMRTVEAEEWTSGACPAPSAEWMRRRIAFEFLAAFGITETEQRNKFLKQAGVMYP